MKWFRIAAIITFTLSMALFSGCREANEGVDELADEVTGKNKIEKKREMKKEIEDITNKANKQQADALKQLTE